MISHPQHSFTEMYRSHPVYSGMERNIRRAGALPVDVMRVVQTDFEAEDPATQSLSLGVLLDANGSSLSVDYGEGRKVIQIPNDNNGIYVNPTWNDTRFVQNGTTALQFVSIPLKRLAQYLDIGPKRIAHAMSPYYEGLLRNKRMRARLIEIWDLSALDCAAAVLAVDHAILSVAAHLLDCQDMIPRSDGADRLLSAREVLHVSDYIEDHLEDVVSLGELARVLGRTAYSFSRAFGRTVGVSPHQYVMSRRVERGRALIERHKDMGLVEIAFACGFSSRPHFSVVFKRFIGVSPGRYRALVRDR